MAEKYRAIVPKMLTSPTLNKCSRFARLTFPDLLVLADDHGRFNADPRVVAYQLFGAEDSAEILPPGCGEIHGQQTNLTWAKGLLTEWDSKNVIVIQSHPGGRIVGYIPNWDKYQTPKYVAKSSLPAATGECAERIRQIAGPDSGVLSSAETKSPFLSGGETKMPILSHEDEDEHEAEVEIEIEVVDEVEEAPGKFDPSATLQAMLPAEAASFHSSTSIFSSEEDEIERAALHLTISALTEADNHRIRRWISDGYSKQSILQAFRTAESVGKRGERNVLAYAGACLKNAKVVPFRPPKAKPAEPRQAAVNSAPDEDPVAADAYIAYLDGDPPRAAALQTEAEHRMRVDDAYDSKSTRRSYLRKVALEWMAEDQEYLHFSREEAS